jgi:hypothetical protein
MIQKENEILVQIPALLKDQGKRMDWFLKSIKMSRTHFYFIKKGDRVLTEEKKKKINELLKTTF